MPTQQKNGNTSFAVADFYLQLCTEFVFQPHVLQM